MTNNRPDYEGSGEPLARALIASGAPNYYGELYENDAGPDIEVIARYVEGKRPIEQLAEAEAKIKRYEEALEKIKRRNAWADPEWFGDVAEKALSGEEE